jgi:predicted solute-binding protein
MNRPTAQHELNTIGWIPYWNLRPLYSHLRRSLGPEFHIIKGHPAEINSLMRDGLLAAAPCSSINLLLCPNAEIALPFGVVANGRVDSVYLAMKIHDESLRTAIHERTQQLRCTLSDLLTIHRGDPRATSKALWKLADLLPPIADAADAPLMKLSSASASGAMLSKIFYRLMFGVKALAQLEGETELAKSSDSARVTQELELVIGDVALVDYPKHAHIIDLGQWWKDLTGLPFVYAVWQQSGKNSIQSSLKAKISELIQRTEMKMRVDPLPYFPQPVPINCVGTPIDLGSYWKKIYYSIGAAEKLGLLTFLGLAHTFLTAELREVSAVKLSRWAVSLDMNHLPPATPARKPVDPMSFA